MRTRPRSITIAAIVAVLFGAVTIVSGGRALFGGVDMGAVAPFVLWFNFLAGFAYVAAGVGLWRGAQWGRALAIAIAASTALIFLAFLWHILQGGAFERRTLVAMILRLMTWLAIVVVSLRRSDIAD
ncbi:hypothetical protein [Thioclava sp.]|uniref:hypothetical protein n=1 Tax=Thioclava sp. TaxID=1933450 RepID=UPI003AA96A5E